MTKYATILNVKSKTKIHIRKHPTVMPDLYESIPPERQTQYLQNAQEAMNEAANPVLRDLGSAAVHGAEQLLADDAQGPSIAEEAEHFVKDNDLSRVFVEEMEKPRESGIAGQAQAYIDVRAAYPKEADKDHEHLWISNRMAEQMNTGSDDAIRNLTKKNNEPPKELPEA